MDGGLYKLAKIYNAGGDLQKQWFVYFYQRKTLSENFVRQRLYANINQYREKKDRMEMARLLRDTVNTCLKRGDLWASDEPDEQQEIDGRYYNCIAALREVVKNKTDLRKKSGATYSSIVNLFAKYCKKTGIDVLPVTFIKGIHIQRYQTTMVADGLSPTTINNRIRDLGNLFSKLCKLDIIPKNPCDAVDNLKQIESTVFEPYTAEELTTIAEHLKQHDPELFLFWLHIYYCFMRPATIVKMRGSDYDFVNKKIRIAAVDHKNNKSATKQMMLPLFEYLLAFGVDKIAPGTYLFASNLKPGPKPGHPNRAAERWRQQIIIGLGIDKKLYAAKHTGGIDYINANSGVEDINWLQQQMSHHSLSETQTYIKNRQTKMLDETKANIKKI